jgi:type I restriction enzyme S subunit
VVIPADWKELRIGEFCDANWGNTAITKSSYVNSGITAFSASGPDGFVSWHERIGDGIVLSAIGALCGKTWLAEGKWTPIKNTIWMQVQSPDFSTKYLYYATGDPKFWPSRGAAQPFIGLGDVRNLKVQLPPLKEQEAIAEALSDADAAIESLDALITKKRDVKQATMQQLLTGRTRLPGFNADWKEVRLGDHASMRSGGTPLTSVASFYGGTIPWASISDMSASGKYLSVTDRSITEAGLASSPAVVFPERVLLYAMYASIGECCISLSPMATSQAILGIKCASSLDLEFLYYIMQSKRAEIALSGQQGTQSNLNAQMVRETLFTMPPLKEQEAIADALRVIDDELEVLTEQVTKLRMVKEGMMQDLLTGKVRLV